MKKDNVKARGAAVTAVRAGYQCPPSNRPSPLRTQRDQHVCNMRFNGALEIGN